MMVLWEDGRGMLLTCYLVTNGGPIFFSVGTIVVFPFREVPNWLWFAIENKIMSHATSWDSISDRTGVGDALVRPTDALIIFFGCSKFGNAMIHFVNLN